MTPETLYLYDTQLCKNNCSSTTSVYVIAKNIEELIGKIFESFDKNSYIITSITLVSTNNSNMQEIYQNLIY